MSVRRRFSSIPHAPRRPRRWLAPLVCGLVVSLAGCRLDSPQPLLPVAAGEPALGQRFLAAPWTEDGPGLNGDGRTTLVAGRFEDGAYVLAGQDAWSSVSLHPVRGQGVLKLVQATGKDGSQTVYAFGRVEGRDLKLILPEVGKARRAALRAAGLDFVAADGTGVTVDSPLRLWRFVAATLARDSIATAAPHLAYRLAATPAEERALRAAVAQAECLALAGHPQDPAVARLPGAHAAGRWMNAIDAQAAEPACRAAVAARPRRATRWARTCWVITICTASSVRAIMLPHAAS